VTVRLASAIALAAAALIAGSVATAQAQTAGSAVAKPEADAKFSADAATCKDLVRAAFARSEPRTLTLTDEYGRRTEGLIGTIGAGRYPGLYNGRQERDEYRYCMHRRGWANPDEAGVVKP